MVTESTDQVPAEIAALVAAVQIPDVIWVHGDDLCDCTFQRIGMWTNPYIARTLKVRFCCIWEALFEQYPDFVQRIPGFLDYNSRAEDGGEDYVTQPMLWNGEHDMPRAIWYRQIQALTGEDLGVIRERYADVSPPRGRPR